MALRRIAGFTLVPEVEDEAGWEKVESMVKGWMTSKKKISNINVALVISYRKTMLGTDGFEVELRSLQGIITIKDD